MKNKWITKTIGELPIIIGDGNYSSKYPKQNELLSEGIPFISNKDIKKGKILRDGLRYLSKSKHAELLKGHTKTGDILISTRANIGDAALVDSEYDDANINAQLVFLRVDEKILHNRYLFQLIMSDSFQKMIKSYSTGSAQAQLPIKQLLKIPITYPDIDTQKKIGEILSTFDESILKTSKIIKKTEMLKKGMMEDIFSQKVQIN